MTKNTLLLASQSKSRQHLLDLAQIPYKVISHKSDECGIELKKSFDDYVLAIAQHKMECVKLPNPQGSDGKTIFVLTADTLMRTKNTKQILGKPTDKNHAKQMLELLCKEPIELATACCLEKKIHKDNSWVNSEKNHWVTPAALEFCVEKDLVEEYLQKAPRVLNACGAGMIEGYGINFLKSVNGSYSAIIGLPLYELRQALKKMSFFS